MNHLKIQISINSMRVSLHLTFHYTFYVNSIQFQRDLAPNPCDIDNKIIYCRLLMVAPLFRGVLSSLKT
jgi:hypothetical protein